MPKYEKMYKLEPSLYKRIWGGGKLCQYGKNCDCDGIGESWELSFIKDMESSAMGIKLPELFGRDAWGACCQGFDKFPVLTKFIDAKDALSVQVHPNDEYALKNEGCYGKTEMWYVVSADEGAGLYMGLNRECTPEEFSAAIEDGSIEQLLSFKRVKAGDVFFIPAGTVHAIGGGVLIYEIQQSSDLTYRIYDYMRRDKDGNPRELHIDKAIAVSSLYPYEPESWDGDEIIGKCKYFITKKYDFDNSTRSFEVDNSSYLLFTVTSGNGFISYTDDSGEAQRVIVKAGESYLFPANAGSFISGGTMTVITVGTQEEQC